MAQVFPQTIIKNFEEHIEYGKIINENIIIINKNAEFYIYNFQGEVISHCYIPLKNDEEIKDVIICDYSDYNNIMGLIITDFHHYTFVYLIDDNKLFQISLPCTPISITASSRGVAFVGFENGRVLGIDIKAKCNNDIRKLNPCGDKNLLHFIANNNDDTLNANNSEHNSYLVTECEGPITSCLCIDDIECLLIGQADGSCVLFDLISANVIIKSSCENSHIETSSFKCLKQPNSETLYLIASRTNKTQSIAFLTVEKIIYSPLLKNKQNVSCYSIPVCKISINSMQACDSSFRLYISHVVIVQPTVFSFTVVTSSLNCVNSYLVIFDLDIFSSTLASNDIKLNASSTSLFSDYYYTFLDIRRLLNVPLSIAINGLISLLGTIPEKFRKKVGLSVFTASNYMVNIYSLTETQFMHSILPDRITHCGKLLKNFCDSVGHVTDNHIQDIFCATSCQYFPSPPLSVINYLFLVGDLSTITSIATNHQFQGTSLRENLLSISNKLFNSISKKIVRALSGGITRDLKSIQEIHTNLLDFYSEIVKFDDSLGIEKGIEITTWLNSLGLLLKIYNFCIDFNIDQNTTIEIDHKNDSFFIFHVVRIINTNLKEENQELTENLSLTSTCTLRDLFYLALIKSEIPIFTYYIYYAVRNYFIRENLGMVLLRKFIKILKIGRSYKDSFKSLWYFDHGYYEKGVKAWFKVYNKNEHLIVPDQNFLLLYKAAQLGNPSHLLSKLIIETIIISKNRPLDVFMDYLVQHADIEYILSNLETFLHGPLLQYLWFFLTKYDKIVAFVRFLSFNAKYQHIYRRMYYEIPSSVPFITVFEKINPIKLNLNNSNFDEIRTCKDKLIKTMANLSLIDSQSHNQLDLIKNALSENRVSEKNFLHFAEQISKDSLELAHPKIRRNIQESEAVLPDIKYSFNTVSVNLCLDMKYFSYFSQMAIECIKSKSKVTNKSVSQKRKYSEFYEDIQQFVEQNMPKKPSVASIPIKPESHYNRSSRKQANILESTRGPSDFPLLSPSKELSQKSGKSSDIFYAAEPVTVNPSPSDSTTPFGLISIDESIISPPSQDSKKSSRIYTKRINKIIGSPKKYNLRARNTTSTLASPVKSAKVSRVNKTIKSNLSIKRTASKVGKQSQLQNRTVLVENYLKGTDYIQLRSRKVENLSSNSSIVSSLRSRKSMKQSPVKETAMPKRARIKK